MRRGRPFFRRGAGRALVRFLIGEVALFIVCALAWQLTGFVRPLPAAAPIVALATATRQPTDAPEPAPTLEPTPELTPVPTLEPTPEPTPSPTPELAFCQIAANVRVPASGEGLSCELLAFEFQGERTLWVRLRVALEGADDPEAYLALTARDGLLKRVFSVWRASDGCFEARLDASSWPEERYALAVIARDGERSAYAPVAGGAFSLSGGLLTIDE